MAAAPILPKRVVAVCKPVPAPAPDPPGERSAAGALIAARRALARDEHVATLAGLEAALRGLPIALERCEEADPARLLGASLVLSVGGDGTFLTAARATRAAPILGVNSSPSTSVGHYCGATLTTVRAHVEAILTGTSPAHALARIAVQIDGAPLPSLALNDALFANTSPALSTRYALEVGGEVELQLSSGIWIATASGSTAAIRSAGGEVMAAGDRRLQYLVREPCRDAAGGPRLGRGFVSAITIVSRSDRNGIFLDGQPEAHAVPSGATAVLSVADEPLLVHGYPAR